MPAACASLQLDPETDWMFWADPGKAGLGMKGRRMRTPRGKMLGGSSGINYMVWVRGHPQDFDHWAELGADGWSYDEVLPAFKRMEDLVPSNEITIDQDVHGRAARSGVAVRSPMIPATRQFVEAAEAAGIPRGDYNGKDRLNPGGRLLGAPDQYAQGQTVEHLSRLSGGRGRSAAQSDDHHRRAWLRAWCWRVKAIRSPRPASNIATRRGRRTLFPPAARSS